jgi:hypothetical protein
MIACGGETGGAMETGVCGGEMGVCGGELGGAMETDRRVRRGR